MRLDWGTVPAWLTAGSLLLAFRIFLRDRSNRVRSQVDKLGVWLNVTSGLQSVDSQTLWHFHNSSDSPIRIVQYAARLDTVWRVKVSGDPADDDGIKLQEIGASAGGDGPDMLWHVSTGKRFKERWEELEPPLVVPPNTCLEHKTSMGLLSLLCPKRAIGLHDTRGLSARILWCLVIDNAGRRWEIRPGGTGLARHIGAASRRKSEYPVSWQRRYGPVSARLIIRTRTIGRKVRRAWASGESAKIYGDQFPGHGWRTVSYKVATSRKMPIGWFKQP